MFRLVETPALYPGKTLLALQVGEQGVIDTGVEMPVGGHVYIDAAVEAPEVARLIGWVAPDVHNQLAADLADLQERYDRLRDVLVEQKPIVDAVRAAAA